MILAPLTDPVLRAGVRRGASPEEDVLQTQEEILDALARGFPRLLIYVPEDLHPLSRSAERWAPKVPVLALAPSLLGRWEKGRRESEKAVGRAEHWGAQLRPLIRTRARRIPWIENLFRDLSRATGAPLPPGFRGLARRILEHPARYGDLHDLARLTGLTRGALKARFRRRGLPSPYSYLRWLRVMAAAHVLSDRKVTTLEAAHRLSYASGGNFCRFVQSVSGLSPTTLRRTDGRSRAMLAFVEECLDSEARAAWKSLEDLFQRQVA